MPSALESAEAEWLSKFVEMRAAIEKLDLPKYNSSEPQYGSDLGLSDDDFLYGGGTDDLWDLLSDETEEDAEVSSVKQLNGKSAGVPVPLSDPSTPQFNRDWLVSQCAIVASKTSGFEASVLIEQIVAILASDSSGT